MTARKDGKVGVRVSTPRHFTLQATSTTREEYPQADREAREDNLPRQDIMETNQGEVKRTTRQAAERARTCPGCGRMFKNTRGVRIHQGKTKCIGGLHQRKATTVHREVANETLEDQSQEAHHRAQNLFGEGSQEGSEPDVHTQVTVVSSQASTQSPVPSQVSQHTPVPSQNTPAESQVHTKPRLSLPPASDNRWTDLDNQLETILEMSLRGDASRKVIRMSQIIYDCSKDMFGTEKEKSSQNKKGGPSRRQRVIADLRKQQRNVTKRFKKAE